MENPNVPAIAEQFGIISAIIGRARKSNPNAPIKILSQDTHKKKVDCYLLGDNEVLKVTTKAHGRAITMSFQITRPL